MRTSNISSSNFQTAIKDTIVVGQCFGLLPVLGVCEKDALKLRFKFKSWRCAYTIVSIFLQFAMTSFFLFKVFQSSLKNIHSATEMIFYCLNLLTTVLFLRIAMKWPKFCMEIYEMEAVDPTNDSKLRIKFNVSCCVVLTLAFFEHLLSEIHNLAIAVACAPEVPVYESFIKQTFSWIFSIIPYNNFFGVLIHFLQIQLTFNWNYNDLFIICMSIYLTSRFQQINERVIAAKDQNLPSECWRTIREDYNKTIFLVRKVDNTIGSVIFISFANNLFFVCAQLLHTLAGKIRVTARCRDDSAPDKRYDTFGAGHSVYFVYSFVFLVARSLAVSLTAAEVHLASMKPAYALYDVSSATYCVEIEMLLDLIHGNTTALTGLQYFKIKRGLILTILGTIITYELVLLQLAGIGPASSSTQ